MRQDRLQQITGSTIVQEENPLSNTPQGSGAELTARGIPLRYVISQPITHIVKLKIAVGEIDDIALAGVDRLAGRVLLDMTRAAADAQKLIAPIGDRGCGGDRCRWCTQPGKGRKIYDVRG